MSPRPASGSSVHDHVERVVGHRLARRLAHPVVERVPHRLAAVLDGEVHEAGRAAEGRRDGAGLEVVGGGGAAKRHVEMGVHVDAAGHHVLAGRVDGAVGAIALDRQVPADGA